MATNQMPNETDLLLQINRDTPSTIQLRYDELVRKRQAETLNTTEQTELISLTNQFELRDAERVAALAELAQLRQISLPELMTILGIQAPPAIYWTRGSAV